MLTKTDIEDYMQLELFQPTGTEKSVIEDIANRQQFGINKYGTTVAENPLELIKWFQHAYEEALDMAIYLKRSIEIMKEKQ